MSIDSLPALRPERPAWNNGRIIGQRRPLCAEGGLIAASAWRWPTTVATWQCSIWLPTANFGDATWSA